MKTYEIRIGNRVLEYDPTLRLTRMVERLPLEQPKVWVKDEAGSWHYRGPNKPSGDLQHPPSK